MAKRTDKIASFLSTRVIEEAVQHFRNTGESERFGVFTVLSVEVTSDYSYADVFVHSSKESDGLPKSLAPLAQKLRREVAKNGLFKAPIIRFKVANPSADENEQKILELINRLTNDAGNLS